LRTTATHIALAKAIADGIAISNCTLISNSYHLSVWRSTLVLSMHIFIFNQHLHRQTNNKSLPSPMLQRWWQPYALQKNGKEI
jgi:hypothetical protein